MGRTLSAMKPSAVWPALNRGLLIFVVGYRQDTIGQPKSIYFLAMERAYIHSLILDLPSTV